MFKRRINVQSKQMPVFQKDTNLDQNEKKEELIENTVETSSKNIEPSIPEKKKVRFGAKKYDENSLEQNDLEKETFSETTVEDKSNQPEVEKKNYFAKPTFEKKFNKNNNLGTNSLKKISNISIPDIEEYPW